MGGRAQVRGPGVLRSYPQTSAALSSGPLQPHSQPSSPCRSTLTLGTGSPDTVRHHGDIQLFRLSIPSCQCGAGEGSISGAGLGREDGLLTSLCPLAVSLTLVPGYCPTTTSMLAATHLQGPGQSGGVLITLPPSQCHV